MIYKIHSTHVHGERKNEIYQKVLNTYLHILHGPHRAVQPRNASCKRGHRRPLSSPRSDHLLYSLLSVLCGSQQYYASGGYGRARKMASAHGADGARRILLHHSSRRHGR